MRNNIQPWITLKRLGDGLDELVLIFSGYLVREGEVVASDQTSLVRLSDFDEIVAVVVNVKAFEGDGPVRLVLGGRDLTMDRSVACTIHAIFEQMLFEAADHAYSVWLEPGLE